MKKREPKIKAMSGKRERRTEERYLTMMEEMYVLGEFRPKDMVSKHNVSGGIFTALRDLGYIKQGNFYGVREWVGSCPKIEDAKKVRIKISDAVARSKNKEVKKTKPENNTITEEQALQVLRNSEKYTYEIYRVETKISRQKLS